MVWTETTLYLQFRLLLTTCRHNVTRDLRRCGAVAVKEFVGWSQKDIFPDFLLVLDLKALATVTRYFGKNPLKYYDHKSFQDIVCMAPGSIACYLYT